MVAGQPPHVRLLPRGCTGQRQGCPSPSDADGSRPRRRSADAQRAAVGSGCGHRRIRRGHERDGIRRLQGRARHRWALRSPGRRWQAAAAATRAGRRDRRVRGQWPDGRQPVRCQRTHRAGPRAQRSGLRPGARPCVHRRWLPLGLRRRLLRPVRAPGDGCQRRGLLHRAVGGCVADLRPRRAGAARDQRRRRRPAGRRPARRLIRRRSTRGRGA